MTQDQTKARTEINKVLEQQASKGIKRNEVCRSLFHFGFSEHQVGAVMGINPKSAHASKLSIGNGQREKKEIRNFLVLDVIRLQGFLKNVKTVVGKPSHRKEEAVDR
jgi:hypothetical protein